jgi:sec-independent protein translocase protein TatA
MLANVGDLPYFILIAVVALIGGNQLPKLARNLGLAGREYRKAQTEAEEEAAREAREKTVPPPVPLPPTAAQTPAAAPEGSITLTPAQLDALLKAREEQARSGSDPSAN